MEDSQIVALYFQRSERAIDETAKKYGKYCYHIAYNILRNREDTEETVSDTYLGAWATIPPHKPVVLSTFLGKIARRTAIKRYQHSRTQKRGGGEVALALEELSEFLSDGQNPESTIENAELTKLLNDFLRALPKEERSVFVCRYWYFDSIEDIASRFRYSESKVKMMLKRSRDRLREHLLKEGVVV